MISGPFLGTTSMKPGISRTAGCFQACLSATCDSSDALEFYALANETHLIWYADIFHFSTPSRFSKVAGCNAGTYAGIVSPTRARLPRRHRPRFRGPTSRRLGRRQSARLRQYQPGRRRGTRSRGRNAQLAPVPGHQGPEEYGRHEQPKDENKRKTEPQKEVKKSGHALLSFHSREEDPRFCQSPRQKRHTTQSRSSASSMTRSSPCPLFRA